MEQVNQMSFYHCCHVPYDVLLSNQHHLKTRELTARGFVAFKAFCCAFPHLERDD